jgi:hypothetical protein
MKEFVKYLLMIFGTIAAITAIIFGSYQPFVKSQIFIRALRNQGNIKTFDEFKSNFDLAFNSPSQVGDEELEKFLSDTVISLISSQNQTEEISQALVDYIEPHVFRNDVRGLLSYANMRTILYQRFHRESDFNKAEETYLHILTIGPKLPPALYSTLKLYSIKEDEKKFRGISETILSYWPDDVNLKNFVDSLK